jgi:hypothetical protein
VAEHIWSVLCESSAVDKYTNQVSLFSVIEGLNFVYNGEEPSAEGDVSIGVHMRLVSYWTRTRRDKPERAELRMSLELPSSKVIPGQVPVAIDLDMGPRARTISQIGSLRYGGSGEYAMLVDYRSLPGTRWKRVARLPFELTARSAASLAGMLRDSTQVAAK